jgi:hypothetical protein
MYVLNQHKQFNLIKIIIKILDQFEISTISVIMKIHELQIQALGIAVAGK